MDEPVRYPATRWLLLLAAALSFVCMQVANVSIAPLFPVVGKDLGLGPAQLGNLMSVYTFSACLVLFWLGGTVADRLGPVVGCFLSMLCAALPMTFIPVFGHSYHAMIVIRLIEGMSMGFAFPAQAVVLAHWFAPQQRGLASGLTGAALTIGVQIGVYGGAIPVEKFGISWQSASAYISVIAWVGVIFTLILMALRLKAPLAGGHGRAEKSELKHCFFTPLTFLGVGTVFMGAWVFFSLTNMVPGALATPGPLGAGYTALQSSSLMLGVTIAGTVGPILGGFILDKVFHGSSKALILPGFVLMFVFAGLMASEAVIHNPALTVLCLAMAALGFQFIFPVILIHVGKVYPLPVVGKMIGFWMGIGNLGGVIGQAVGGETAQAMGSYSWMYALMSAAGFIGFFIALPMLQRRPVIVSASSTVAGN